MATKYAVWVLAVALILGGAACGGDDDTDGGAIGAAGVGIANSGGGSGAVRAGTGGATAPTGTSAGRSGSGSSGSSAGSAGRSGEAGRGAGGADPDAGTAACTLMCGDGEHCELVEVQCFRAPCPAQPSCVADTGARAAVDCDLRKVACDAAEPACDEGEVPSVSGACYGPCVTAESCACDEPEDCPDADHYTCHSSAGHCGPYV